MSDSTAGINPPVFMSAGSQPPQPRQQRLSREFERLVKEDLRDKFAAGPAYAVLSRSENRIAWLQTLHGIRDSIGAQNAHDKALLAAHPDRPVGGGVTPESYANAKREIEDRKRRRSRAAQAVTDRISEVRRLIGVEPLEGRALGQVIDGLLTVQRCVTQRRCDDASQKIALLLRALSEEVAS